LTKTGTDFDYSINTHSTLSWYDFGSDSQFAEPFQPIQVGSCGLESHWFRGSQDVMVRQAALKQRSNAGRIEATTTPKKSHLQFQGASGKNS